MIVENVKTESQNLDGNKTKYQFTARADRTLRIVTNCLYQNKDIVLRELISNASDACSKLRIKYLSDPSTIEDETVLRIVIETHPGERTLTITDNGIGMNKDDLVENLGTIAKSGTEEMLESLPEDQRSDMIGQFGVGFYSAFMIADKVTVKTRKVKEEKSWIWRSNGIDDFEIEESSEEFPVGTSVVLHLRDGEDKFLDKFKIEHIVSHHSNYVLFPIEYVDESGNTERLNSASAIWVKNKNEVTEEEHAAFFRDVSHVGGAPYMIFHNHNEGSAESAEYINLLYVPSIKPFNLFHPDRKCFVKLYSRRCFITEDNVQVIPPHLRFLRGIVDCDDLPLNVSRETLQDNRVIEKIRRSITNRVLSELAKKMKNDVANYVDGFWNNFGPVLKEGLCDAVSTEDKERLLSVCMFYSAKHAKFISLDEYLDSSVDNQEFIFYASGRSIEGLKNSPSISAFISRNIDVLFFTDSVDDFWNIATYEYKHMRFKSITRSDIDLRDFPVVDGESQDQEHDKSSEDEVKSLMDFMNDVLKDLVSNVRVSNKLVDMPSCLVVTEGSMDIRMEKFMIDQKQLAKKSKKILEINVSHPIVKKLMGDINSEKAKDIALMLFDQACIVEGEEIEDPGSMVKRINDFILSA